MASPQDFKSLQDDLQKSLVSTVKAVNRIAAEDLPFQRTVNPDAAEQLDEKTGRMLDLSTRLLQSAAKACGVKAPPKLEDADDVDMTWRGVVDVVDSLLEKADTALDEYTGLVKRKDPPTHSETEPKRQKSTNKVIRNANISKPQARFEVKPDNFPSKPWEPIITKKPHATVPLKKSIATAPNANGSPQCKHPYETEIKAMEYPPRIFEHAEPIPPQPVETTQPTWVDTYGGVIEMLKELRQAKEIAVDLEHHDFRTYTGLVSLMQISTREKDWVVDTLQPWRHKLEVLNEVFADPSIIKVFHGAYMDMIWLQRDLGLYINGLFDTYFACEVLYSARSLAFLLSKFVNFDADKQYQLADWRMRPLPEEMMFYARSDTHFLLYIYDRIRNDLVEASDRSNPETDYIGRVLQKSRDLSLSRHEHAGYDEESGEGNRGWANYILKHAHQNYSSEQFAVFRAVWKWRDATARKDDESPNFVLGTPHIAEIARVNPPDAKALHSLLPQTAPLARTRLTELWEAIRQGKAQGGPSLAQFFTSVSPESVRHSGLPRLSKVTAQLPGGDGDVTVNRLSKSHLFGNMPISSKWDGSQETSEASEDRIPFPWQRFVQEAPSEMELDEGAVSNGEAVKQEEEAPQEAPTPEELDPEFTLKKGTKRKSAAMEEETSSSDDEEDEEEDEVADGREDLQESADGLISLVDEPAKQLSKKQRKKERKAQARDAEVERIEKQEAKAARKAQKKQKKQAAAAAVAAQGDGSKPSNQAAGAYSAVPFDYSQAASVMHAKRDAAAGSGSKDGGGDKKNKKQKVFDPYGKTGDDALKGARKAPPVRGERSATFRK